MAVAIGPADHSDDPNPGRQWPVRGVVLAASTLYLLATLPGSRDLARAVLGQREASSRVLGVAAFAAAAALTARPAARPGPDRWPCAVLAAGFGAVALTRALGAVAPVPPVGVEIGRLALYVCAYASLPLLLRFSSRRMTAVIWLDVCVVALCAATVLAGLVYQPVLGAVAERRSAPLTDVVCPAFDLIVLAWLAVAAVAPAARRRLTARWWLTLAAVGLVVASDGAYLLRIVSGPSGAGGVVDGVWAAAAGLVALAASFPAARQGSAAGPGRRTGHRLTAGRGLAAGHRSAPLPVALAAPGAAGCASVALLIWAAYQGGLAVYVVVPGCLGIMLALLRLVIAGRTAATGPDRPRGLVDDLTGLASRRGFFDHAARVLAEPAGPGRGPGPGETGLLVVGLDRFREVNDSLGPQAGDRVLAGVGLRLAGALGGTGHLARVGGDEFAVLLPGVDPAGAERMAVKARDVLSVPFPLAGMRVQVDASVGIAIGPRDGTRIDELLSRAGSAMFEAKRSRGGHRFYGPDCGLTSRDRLKVRSELRGALREDQLTLRYQPKADLRTGAVHGVEALVRWVHPTEGVRTPDRFLPEMEQAGLMPALTARVLDLALADCARWRAAGRALTVAVNVPPSVIVDEGLPGRVDRALARAGLPASALRIEITEDALLARRDVARRTMAALRARGVKISLDDYGTGYCSLSYLRELPVDELKLDKSFVTGMLEDNSAVEIVRSTIQLAHALNLRMVAEGVESIPEWQRLAAWGCDEAQGYYVAKPMTADHLLGWLAGWPDPSPRAVATATYVSGRAPDGTGGLMPVAVRHRTRQWSARFHAAARLDASRTRPVAGRGGRSRIWSTGH